MAPGQRSEVRAASRSAAISRSIASALVPCASTGAGIWGPPADRKEALRTLKRLPDLGINFVDTSGFLRARRVGAAQRIDPKGMLIATKAGFDVPGLASGRWMGVPNICARKR